MHHLTCIPQAQEAKKKAEKDKAIAAAMERAAADYEDGVLAYC